MAFCLNMDRKSKENIVNRIIRVLTLQNGLSPLQIRTYAGITLYQYNRGMVELADRIIRKDKKIYLKTMVESAETVEHSKYITIDGYTFKRQADGKYMTHIDGKYTLMHRYLLRDKLTSKQDIVKSHDNLYHHTEADKYYIVKLSSLYNIFYRE